MNSAHWGPVYMVVGDLRPVGQVTRLGGVTRLPNYLNRSHGTLKSDNRRPLPPKYVVCSHFFVCINAVSTNKKAKTKTKNKQSAIQISYLANSDKQTLQLNNILHFEIKRVMRVIEGKLDTLTMFYASFFRQTKSVILAGMPNLILFSFLWFLSLFFYYY